MISDQRLATVFCLIIFRILEFIRSILLEQQQSAGHSVFLSLYNCTTWSVPSSSISRSRHIIGTISYPIIRFPLICTIRFQSPALSLSLWGSLREISWDPYLHTPGPHEASIIWPPLIGRVRFPYTTYTIWLQSALSLSHWIQENSSWWSLSSALLVTNQP